MIDGRETFVVKVMDSQGRDLFAGSFQAATYHRALRIAWAETADDRPLWPTDSPGSLEGNRWVIESNRWVISRLSRTQTAVGGA